MKPARLWAATVRGTEHPVEMLDMDAMIGR
jgi:hypothetical protein